MLSFFVPGPVKAKQSMRVAVVGRFARKFTAKDVTDYANWVKQCFCAAYPNHTPEQFIGKMLKVSIFSYFTVPKSFSKRKQTEALEGIIRPTKKPDCDNISKNILDALNKIAYPDDSQIVALFVSKKYSASDRVVVEISEV